MQNTGPFSAVPVGAHEGDSNYSVPDCQLPSYAPVLARCGHDLPALLQVLGDKASDITAARTLTGPWTSHQLCSASWDGATRPPKPWKTPKSQSVKRQRVCYRSRR
ncbi:hypothetical protein EMPG_17238 [Blastomyces silverae]|uniref:Uncharacterized protein n=1 Tax=Blastomyces silverae TaxID=2060906 RepID=A0A0H1B733_9EURO|nr:hypothetical protein EMPG_17238 [Blastomyces silverae]